MELRRDKTTAKTNLLAQKCTQKNPPMQFGSENILVLKLLLSYILQICKLLIHYTSKYKNTKAKKITIFTETTFLSSYQTFLGIKKSNFDTEIDFAIYTTFYFLKIV